MEDKKTKNQRGVLTIEATISFSIFMMVILTMLLIMRIVYVYALVQHAAVQTAKELSTYTYLYQVLGVNDLRDDLVSGTSAGTSQLNDDIDEVMDFYNVVTKGGLTDGEISEQDRSDLHYEGTTDPVSIIKNMGAALINNGATDINNAMFEFVVKPLMEGYIGADSRGSPADTRLRALGVTGGMDGLHLEASHFFEDGETIDIVVCYTLDPIFPIDIMPEMNLVNRAYVRGINGESMFE